MSKGDKLIGKKTMYKDIEMRSRFETKIAFFLDALKIKWIYEPKTFMLSNGILYCPDFFLPELNMWVEAKGVIGEHNKEISRCFVKNNNTELLLISPDKTWWFSMKDFIDYETPNEDNCVYLGKCTSCNSYFFTSNIGNWYCRKCCKHDGKHSIIVPIVKTEHWGNWIVQDFSDINSIKRGLKEYGISI